MIGREAKKTAASLMIGMLLILVLTAGPAYTAEVSATTDGQDVEIAYLNDAAHDEPVLMEEALLEGIYAAKGNDTLLSDPGIIIEGVEDQPWTGNPVTLPNLKVKNNHYSESTYDPWHWTFIYLKDYEVEYENNIDPGTAKVKIIGREYNWWEDEKPRGYGSLSGSITKEFKIIKEAKETEPQNDINLPKGTVATLGSGATKAVYTVTGNTTMTYTKCKAGKNATSAKVPETVVMIGQTYRVTGVAKKAFSGMKKLKKVTIGKYVAGIGANAFEKCGKLKTLIVKSASLKASKCKKCLKGSSIKTVKVPASVKKTYKKKIFVKKVCGLKVTVK